MLYTRKSGASASQGLNMSRGAKVEVRCACCRAPFLARVADRKRGWGRFCSKRCKARKQEQQTDGQYRRCLEWEMGDDFDPSWDAHKWETGDGNF